ncbi:hypothetical protein [Piscirickettsia litoralis]|uniref:Uncharacterized protein n=1 Tax=Piscirickettsia litoralis TaxID=1891921 RepID=A0ABX3A3W7_9GAMM|nr:hypothetical protein [Piscirickettsia litoralis]ODN42937.1 hypothetical protein BGC07_08395 [Piscirickettsia litoralis]
MSYRKYLMKKSVTFVAGMASVMVSINAVAEISPGSNFSSLLMSPNQCSQGSCPSGAYFVQGGDADALYNLGTIIGGGQDKMGQPAPVGKTTEWSNSRYAILIGAGNYPMTEPFKIGYYTQVLGVGSNRGSVTVSPGINILNTANAQGQVAPQPGGSK